MSRSCDILIAGGGPAGCVAAMMLAELGHRPLILTAPRRWSAVEGASARVVRALEDRGCAAALASLGPMVRRQVAWQGMTGDANREWLVERASFDAALLVDAGQKGVRVEYGRIAGLRATGSGWQAHLADGRRFAADFLIEARGRAAPGRRRRGPGAIALGRSLADLPKRGCTAVASMPDGWIWLATTGDGDGSLQIVTTPPLPKKSALEACWRRMLDDAVAASADVRAWLGNARPVGPVRARHADTNRTPAPTGACCIRIGDAALAMDPLAGHGLFEAIASATAAGPVVNTMLRRPADGDLARRFHAERVRLAFDRFARTGRDFYGLETRHGDRRFWTERLGWPDDLPAHPRPGSASPEIVDKPVVEDGFVRARPVIVTADQPRGVWQVDQVPLVALLDLCRNDGATNRRMLAARLNRSVAQVTTALGWLRHQGLV